MILMGIDAAHRATGVVIAETNGNRVSRILYRNTLTTKKTNGTIAEYNQVLKTINEINRLKTNYLVRDSVCEIAHSGQNFSSARNVGITWAISIATNSKPFTSSEVRKLFGADKKKNAKDEAYRWLSSTHFHLAPDLMKMDHHQVDALACLATYIQKLL